MLQSPMNLIIKHNKRQNEKNQNNRDTLSATKNKKKRKKRKKTKGEKKAANKKSNQRNGGKTEPKPNRCGAESREQQRELSAGPSPAAGYGRRAHPADPPRLPGGARTPGQPHAGGNGSLWGSCSCEAPTAGLPGGLLPAKASQDQGGYRHGWAGGCSTSPPVPFRPSHGAAAACALCYHPAAQDPGLQLMGWLRNPVPWQTLLWSQLHTGSHGPHPRHTTHTRRAALPLPIRHMAPPKPPRPVQQCLAASRHSCRRSLGISLKCRHSLPVPQGRGRP